MEPLKINIEVNLGEATLAVLDKIVDTMKPQVAGFDLAPKAEESKPKPASKKTKPAPQPVPDEPAEPAVAPADYDDLPPDDAPAPTKQASKPTPTEADARAAVKAAKDRGVSPKAIRSYMQDIFGIASSVDCPAERRQELIDGLNNLAA